MAIDASDPRPPYQQVANDLRQSIQGKRFAPGDRLPSGKELSEHYGVARMTIQQALRLLRDEHLIVSRQGSGVFVRAPSERPIGLRPHIERAFEADTVTLDFAGFSGETLAGAMSEPLDKVRAGRLAPESLRVRLLVPDTTRPWVLPSALDTQEDDPQFRERASWITGRSLSAISEAVHELHDLGLVAHATAEVRVHSLAPLFKLYVLNGADAFFGFYPVTEHTVRIQGEEHRMLDLMGKDATLFHHAADEPDSRETAYVQQAQLWFDTVWTRLGRPAS